MDPDIDETSPFKLAAAERFGKSAGRRSSGWAGISACLRPLDDAGIGMDVNKRLTAMRRGARRERCGAFWVNGPCCIPCPLDWHWCLLHPQKRTVPRAPQAEPTVAHTSNRGSRPLQ